ncbi:protein ALP1-like [Helianthus annuus]|uniref:protein ALP1-like n=1 Tax=Helianthus annuus TaxID=4232 RepID=UPI000B8F8848|nr:protein ALP1-like [Helianthus annuus]
MWSNIQQIYEVHEQVHGLPRMLGSIDCMHWAWGNCPAAWRGQHERGRHPGPSIMLEAVASYDLWIWHAFFGTTGSNNDINVFHVSLIFNDVVDGVALGQVFYVKDQEYTYGYYLSGGIYPERGTIVQAFSYPHDDKRKLFTKRESVRKDIERAFGVQKKRWAIIFNPARMCAKEKLRDVMYACLILHNMILEDEGKAICQNYEGDVPRLPCTISNEQKLRIVRKFVLIAFMTPFVQIWWNMFGVIILMSWAQTQRRSRLSYLYFYLYLLIFSF